MKQFRRTNSGLRNQHLFYNVDIVLFVEGGNLSYSKAEVYSGLHHEETGDIIFWRNIFSVFRNSEKVKFKSVGSKSTIKEIAFDVIDGQLQTVMVAMDSEFDEILNQKIKHPNILYTHGYSYENDVWNATVIKNIIEELTATEIQNDEIKDALDNFLKAMKLPVYADGYLFKKGSSFFPRKTGYLFCVNCNSNDLPVIKKEEIEKKLVDKAVSKQSAYAFGSKNRILTHQYCFGHLLADYCCQIILAYLKKKHLLSGPRKDILYRMAIRKYFQVCFSKSPLYNYYKLQLTQNEA